MLNVDIKSFTGPLDLLSYLLDVNQVDLSDIPLATITEQYLVLIEQIDDDFDMELASEFLVMASTLMQIKSRLLLPKQVEGEEEDLKEELVLQLLRYRRNKLLAQELADNYQIYKGNYFRTPAKATALGISPQIIEDKLDLTKFKRAVKLLVERNAEKFSDQQQRIRKLLKREKFSVKAKIIEIATILQKRLKATFSDLFPYRTKDKRERIAGFLAILEMVARRQIIAKQSLPFSEITLHATAKEEAQNDR